jgi:23S rRNA (guanosine2251-2'-O)-methyltransferase
MKDRASPFAPQAYAVEGLAAVAEYLRFRPAVVSEIRCEKSRRPAIDALLAAAGARVPVHEREAARGGDGEPAPVSAKVLLKALEPDAFKRRRTGRATDLVLALDHITDPRNLGAIVRSAAFFGVDAVLAPERRQVLLTQAAVATAQGGFALTDLVCVVNLSRALQELKDEGYWVIGAAMDGEPLAKVAGEYQKVVLVLGNEESGLSKGVREHCDRCVAISGNGKLDSLNVSVAAGICLAALKGR